MATDLRTEQDLRAALDLLCSDAPDPAAVLPTMRSALATTPARRRLAVWLLPVTAALAIVGIAVGLTFAPSSPPAADHQPSGPNQVVGVWWQLQRINGRHSGTVGLSLDIGPRGSLQQALDSCDQLAGHVKVLTRTLRLSHVQHQIRICPIPNSPGPSATPDLLRLLRGEVTWSVSDNTLTLHRAGLTAIYAPHPGSGTPSRQWTYRGVGISVPATWPRNALHCAAPTSNSVIYPDPVSTCPGAGNNHATTVWFSPLDGRPAKLVPSDRRSPIEIDGTPATEGFRQLPDGRQIAEIRVPSHNVAVTIASPDAGLAGHLAGFEIYIAR